VLSRLALPCFCVKWKSYVCRQLLESRSRSKRFLRAVGDSLQHDRVQSPSRTGVRVAADDREFAVRLARYCARNPVALGRVQYRERDSSVTYHSDKPTGPTAGSETIDALEFLARIVSHIPNKGEALQRYYGFYASRRRGMRRKATEGDKEQPLVKVDPEPEVLREARPYPRTFATASPDTHVERKRSAASHLSGSGGCSASSLRGVREVGHPPPPAGSSPPPQPDAESRFPRSADTMLAF